MRIRFKNGNEYDVQNLLEQKVFNNSSSPLWVIGFSFTANLNSSSLDELLTPDNIAQLTITDAEENAASSTIAGYEKITSTLIRHITSTNAVIEVQFSKSI